MRSLREYIEERNAELAAAYESGNPIVSCIQTGLPTLDKHYLNERGILTTYQAHPGEGKSSAARIMLHGAASAGYRPIFFPFEDPTDKISDAYTAKELGVSGSDLRNGKLTNPGPRLLAATDALWWTEAVQVHDEKLSSGETIELLEDTIKPDTGIVILDYYQAMDAEPDEKSVERVISRLCWKLLKLAKTHNIAVVGFSQVKNSVLDRGKQAFDRIVFNHQKQGIELKPEPWMVEAFRPVGGDSQWATGIYQRTKDLISIFRPGRWLREMGFSDYKDNVGEWMRVKTNYMEGQQPIRLRWDGPTSSFYEPTKKEKK